MNYLRLPLLSPELPKFSSIAAIITNDSFHCHENYLQFPPLFVLGNIFFHRRRRGRLEVHPFAGMNEWLGMVRATQAIYAFLQWQEYQRLHSLFPILMKIQSPFIKMKQHGMIHFQQKSNL
mmetsp:Transcript_536/g.1147  ORF Transcript_536/g.1147 Transcript_536/m.1147 type:complete len:121 (-) Transcript_536:92-454(-)